MDFSRLTTAANRYLYKLYNIPSPLTPTISVSDVEAPDIPAGHIVSPALIVDDIIKSMDDIINSIDAFREFMNISKDEDDIEEEDITIEELLGC